MTRITNADQVLILLRSHLQRAQRARGSAKPDAPAAAARNAVGRVKQMATSEELSEPELKRALVAGVLTEEFGPTVATAPQFQRLVDNVLGIIERDDASTALLRDAIAQIKPRE